MPRFFLARFTFLFSPNRLPGVLELIVCIFGRFAVGHLAVGPAHGFCKVVSMRLVVRLVGAVVRIVHGVSLAVRAQHLL